MANPIALPGTNVPSGAAVSPGGAQGPSAVSANANNKATLGSDSLVLVQGTAAGVAATTHAQTVSGDDPQLTNARTPSAHEASHVTGSDQIPLASSSTKGLLTQTSGNTTDFIDGTNNSQALQPVIWSVRLRSFNAIGNPTFEVDQRNVGNVVTNPAIATFIIDRWVKAGAGTYTVNMRQNVPSGGPGIPYLPGTNFRISANWFQVVLTGQEASLAAGDALGIRHIPEGIVLRELIGDVHSVSLLVASSVAPLTFAVALRDSAQTRSLIKLCTISTANTWTLITLPNLPVWPAAGTFNIGPGQSGYDIVITLAAGSTNTAPAADTWQTGNFLGAPGMSNFCAQAVNSVFYLGFIQHEPGALCTTPIDCPFGQNLDGNMGCLRYFQKSYDYGIATAAVTPIGAKQFVTLGAATNAFGQLAFPKLLAKTPTITLYNHNTGAANSVQDGAAVNHATTGLLNAGTGGFGGFSFTTATASAMQVTAHYTADTGW